MNDEERLLLRRKWKYQDEFKTFGNVMGKMEGFGVLDLRQEGVIILRDEIAKFNYAIVDRSIEIVLPWSSKNILKLRISELTTEKLKIVVSGKRGDEVDDKFSREIVELFYAPMDDH